jgi:hypothetical protein
MFNGNPCRKSDVASWFSEIETASDELRFANDESCDR